MTNNKDKKVLNVPNLRFSEFTGEWKKCIIGELTTPCPPCIQVQACWRNVP